MPLTACASHWRWPRWPGRSSTSTRSSCARRRRRHSIWRSARSPRCSVLEATRRTTGWILPATAAMFLAYAYFGALLDQAGPVAHRASRLQRPADSRDPLHDARGHLRRAARCHGDLHRAVHDLRRGARAQRSRPVLHRLGGRGGRPIAKRVGRRPDGHRRGISPRRASRAAASRTP